MQVRSLDQEDPLERTTAQFSVLAWRIPWTEEASGHESQNSVPGITVLVAQLCPTLPPHGL